VRRVGVIALVACAAAVAALALGAAASSGPPQRADAAAPTITSLKRTFRVLLPATACDAGAAKRAAALKLRTGALRNVATAAPKVLKRKKAAMRKGIRLLRQAKAACAAQAAPPGGGTTTAPVTPTPPVTPVPTPPVPGTTVITLHVAAGNTTRYTETSAAAPAGAVHVDLVNASNLRHFVAVRTGPGQPVLGRSALSPPGGPTALDITLPAGAYQIFCDNNDHDQLGMVIPFTVG
jgi:hypothetical protein